MFSTCDKSKVFIIYELIIKSIINNRKIINWIVRNNLLVIIILHKLYKYGLSLYAITPTNPKIIEYPKQILPFKLNLIWE